MSRFKAVVSEIKNREAYLLLEDGTCVVFPLEKLPKGVNEGAFLTISVHVDHIASLLHAPGTPGNLSPKGEGA